MDKNILMIKRDMRAEVVSMGGAAVAIGYEKQRRGFIGRWMMLGRGVLH